MTLQVDLETVRNVGLVAVVILLVLGAVLALAIRAVLGKLAVLAVVAVAALVLWTNRANVSECVDQVREAVGTDAQPAPCSFLGIEVDVPVP